MSAALPRVAVLGYGRFGKAFVELLRQAGDPVQVFDPHAAVPADLAAPSLAARPRLVVRGYWAPLSASAW